MDTGKLLRLLRDLLALEKIIDIKGKLEEMRTKAAMNNAEGLNAATEIANALVEAMNAGIPSGLKGVENHILQAVGGQSYFSSGLTERLNAILAGPSYAVAPTLAELNKARDEFLTHAQSLVLAFEAVGIKEYRPDEYEVEFVVPEDQGDLVTLGRRLDDFKKVLTAVAQLSDTESAMGRVRITRISSGSPFQFFAGQDVTGALNLANIFMIVGQVATAIGRLRKKKNEEAKGKDLDATAKEEVEKAIDGQIKRLRDNLLENVPDQVLTKLDKDGTDGEIRNKVRMVLDIVLGWFKFGIQVDITPIRVTVSSESQTATTTQEIPKSIAEVGKILEEVHQLPKEVLSLLPASLDEPQDGTDLLAMNMPTEPEPSDGNDGAIS